MLFTGHLTIFAIKKNSRMIQTMKLGGIEETYPSSCDKNFSLWVIVFLELHSVENRFVASPETSLKQVFRVKMS
jgi:hypothetical protein